MDKEERIEYLISRCDKVLDQIFDIATSDDIESLAQRERRKAIEVLLSPRKYLEVCVMYNSEGITGYKVDLDQELKDALKLAIEALGRMKVD